MLLITDHLENLSVCVSVMRVTNVYQPSFRGLTPTQVVDSQEKVKQKSYVELCLELRPHFSPYVYCTSGLLSREMKALNKRLVLFFARKWNTH